MAEECFANRECGLLLLYMLSGKKKLTRVSDCNSPAATLRDVVSTLADTSPGARWQRRDIGLGQNGVVALI